MSKRLKTIEWKTNEVTLNFDSQLSPLAKALKTIDEYKNNSSESSDPSKILLDVTNLKWHILILWLLNEKFELDLDDGPVPKEIMRMCEAEARVVIAELNVWKALFGFNSIKTAFDYDKALEAWTMTQIESKEEDFSDTCQGLGNRAIADKLRKKREMLVKGKNPFFEDLNKVHHFNMIDSALSIVEPRYRKPAETIGIYQVRTNFCTTVWHPYLYALKKLIEVFRKGVLLEDGSRQKFVRIFQRGRCLMSQDGENIKQIFPKPQKKSLTDRGKIKKNA